MHPYAWLTLAIVTEVVGTIALAASAQFTRLVPSLVVVVLYGASFWLLAGALRTIPVGVAYAIWSGLGVVLIALIGWAALGQRLDWGAVLGMALIVAGVLVIHLFSRTAPH
ncbi:small multidrug resistance pump [Hasllibacter halocynthiae]|uniref:Small multidrug resistance pump n=1 Tax=Hasllibacter halocynthiae TaxID=595589 RepID=A0A2T0X8I6_9RHOB|nr:SMR family transporter [Hasllibacter halocynthiae]PRY95256.1 small multidrug resistance pump [Hasllibacter halocynthiae]